MRNYKIIFIYFLIPTQGFAMQLSWQQASSLARKQNPALEATKKTKNISEANVKKSYGEFFPSVSLSAKRNKSKSEISSAPGISTKSTTDTVSATANLNIFNGFYDISTLSKSRITKEKSQYIEKSESAEIRLKLKQAFINAYIQQERIHLYQKVLDRQMRNEKLISIKYNSGTEARWNVRKSKSETKLALFNLESAKEEYKQALNTVASIIGLSNTIDNVSSPNLIEPKKLNPLAKSAQQNHPSLRKVQLAAKEAEKDVAIAKSAFYPVIALSYTKSREDTKSETTRRSRTEGSAFAISASWNIFNGFTDYYDVQKANLTHESQELTYQDTKNSIYNDIEKYRILYESSYSKIPIAKESKQAAEERLKTVSSQYRSGLKNFIEWEQAESQLAQAEQNEIITIRDAQLNLAQYEYALGKTLDE